MLEEIRAAYRARFGGSPDEVPDTYRASSPLTYVDAVRAPLLITAGADDPRCPLRQIKSYMAALDAAGAVYEFHLDEGGHQSLTTDERIAQAAMVLDFVARVLQGQRTSESSPNER